MSGAFLLSATENLNSVTISDLRTPAEGGRASNA